MSVGGAPAGSGLSLLVKEAINSDKWFCPSPKENVRLFNAQTGETLPIRCNKWTCEYCGRIHAWQWSERVEVAKPKRFLTLTNVGADLGEACEHLTYFARVLRREGYSFQYFAVPELSPKNKLLHFHMLTHGRSWEDGNEAGYIPVRDISDAARRAGMGKIVDIRALAQVKSLSNYSLKHVFGYTVKASGGDLWKDNPRKRRVRYSREFFPKTTADIDAELKAARAGVGVWEFQVLVGGDRWINARSKGDIHIASARANDGRSHVNIFERENTGARACAPAERSGAAELA